MKNFIFLVLLVALSVTFTNCTDVPARHKGVEVSWGGKTNMNKVYPEGMHTGINWLWDDMVVYDVAEKTLVEEYTFNDKNNMPFPVKFALDYSYDPDKVNYIHSKIGADQFLVKVQTSLAGAAKQTLPSYSASELNLTKREEAEQKISSILKQEFPAFYANFARVRITDVGIPSEIEQTAQANAKQLELNKLAESKAVEAENNFKAAEWDAKTKDVLSKPAMLKLKELEIEMEWAKQGVSKYGDNNVFGANTNVLKGLQ